MKVLSIGQILLVITLLWKFSLTNVIKEAGFCSEETDNTNEAGLSSGLVVLVALICFVAGLLGFSLCQKYAGKHIK